MTHQYVITYGKTSSAILTDCEYTEEDWGLSHTMFTPSEHGWVVVHVCDSKRVECWYYWRHFNLPCTNCEEHIPKSLQTLFVLLTDDMAES